jgi:aromatic ring-opening dioxygenase catalytic subunit (LigB family)
MGKIVAGLASSHAYTLLDPSEWDKRREKNRSMYRNRYGVDAPAHPKIADETVEDRATRYQRVRDGLGFLRRKLKEKKPDCLILVGDDQNENYNEGNLPQFALYTGGEVLATEMAADGQRVRGARYRSHGELGQALLEGLVDREFDIAYSKSFPKEELLSHAHGPILRIMDPEAEIPVVLLFVNAIHVPAPSPNRCYRLGQAMREIIQRRPGNERVAIYASGGLSHFTAGYPWPAYKGPHTYGSISEDFDRQALELMRRGEGEKLTALTSADLLAHGDIEMRSWLVLLGAVGSHPGEVLAYEPFYSAVMGMAVGYWEMEDATAKSPAAATV